MSFRLRQKLHIAVPCVPYIRKDVTLENGEIIRDLVVADEEMPDPELFRIENLKAAGESFEEVNSKVLGVKSFDASRIFTTNKETNNSKEN